MGELEGIFVYDIDDLEQIAEAHRSERSREATNAEALIAAEVERFCQWRLTVNAAPAIVELQRQAEEIRQAELKRMQARLGSLSAEQIEAVEALTQGLINKLLHPPMQALKQAARENDAARLESLCQTWSLPAAASLETDQEAASLAEIGNSEPEKAEEARVSETSGGSRR
jgi:glutamyl-tRNA reductase